MRQWLRDVLGINRYIIERKWRGGYTLEEADWEAVSVLTFRRSEAQEFVDSLGGEHGFSGAAYRMRRVC